MDHLRELFPAAFFRDENHWFRKVFQLKHVIIFCAFSIFQVCSVLLFENVNKSSPLIIDEEFHLPQGMAYCKRNFSEYDPKITTPPGLYIISMAILAPFGVCSWYNLRFVNLVANGLNFFLYYIVARYSYTHHHNEEFPIVLTAVNMAILPPLYFFSHVYYTDILSVTFVMAMMFFFLSDLHLLASFSGLFSIIMRQTNVVWVAMFGGIYFTREFMYVLKTDRKNESGDNLIIPDRCVTWNDITDFINNFKHRSHLVKNIKKNVWFNTMNYGAVLLLFVMFIIYNGGIVIGDKFAHQASIHIPQIFYFSLFFIVFGWAFVFEWLHLFYEYITRHFIQASVFLVTFMVIIYFNTIEHEYLLADNRHFTFYVWQRFYQRYSGFRYVMAIPYLCGLYILIKRLKPHRDCSLLIFYLPATFFVLCSQRMIEIRYFFIPFLIARLSIRNAPVSALLIETTTYCVINYLAFDVFFTKNIFWADYEAPQKLIW